MRRWTTAKRDESRYFRILGGISVLYRLPGTWRSNVDCNFDDHDGFDGFSRLSRIETH